MGRYDDLSSEANVLLNGANGDVGSGADSSTGAKEISIAGTPARVLSTKPIMAVCFVGLCGVYSFRLEGIPLRLAAQLIMNEVGIEGAQHRCKFVYGRLVSCKGCVATTGKETSVRENKSTE